MYKEFLIKAVGPDYRKSTSETGFYEKRLKDRVYNSDVDKIILNIFQKLYNSENISLDDVERILSSSKANDSEFLNELFSNPEDRDIIAIGLLGNFRDTLSEVYLSKIKEILQNDAFGILSLAYFDALPYPTAEIGLEKLKTFANILAFVDIMKRDIKNPNDDFKQLEIDLVKKGTEDEKDKYYEILYSVGKIPGLKELREDRYKNLNLKRVKHTTDDLISKIAKDLNRLINSADTDKDEVRTGIKLDIFKYFQNERTTDGLLDNGIINNFTKKVLDQYKLIAPDMNTQEAQKELEEMINIVYKRSHASVDKNRVIKAYTRYYIKNFLPNLVRQASPETMPVIVENGVQEVQNLLYGDNQIIDFNNPAINNQIRTDITKAVDNKDLLSGGASDGMSVEDIAKKWSEIYKIPYQQMLDIIKTQEQAGSIVEQEHTNNLEVSKEIARDHLVEAPDYYSHLENMEENFPSENIAVKPLPEPENMDLKVLDNPLPKNHVCDGSCGGHCQHSVQNLTDLKDAPDGTIVPIKPQTVEDKLNGFNNAEGTIVVTIVSEPEEVQPLNENEAKSVNFINGIAASIKR